MIVWRERYQPFIQALVGRPRALFDAYATLAALEEVVFLAQNANDGRVEKFRVILRKCRPLVSEPYLQTVLTKLVADKEEALVAKTIEKAVKGQMPRAPGNQFMAPVSHSSGYYQNTGRTMRPPPPYRRGKSSRRCFVCNQEGHIARFCPNNL